MATAEESPLKRKRVEPDTTDTRADPVRSDIWYDDGNVILQAEGTLFKVHRGVLARSSSVFEDMFSFPQPPSTDAEMLDGCPIVQLSDSAKEVQYVLEGIFERKYVAFADKLPLAVVSAFICLGKKYDIRTLYVEAVKRMFQEVPATLAEYDGPSGANWLAIENPQHMELAILARKAGLLSALPFLLYESCVQYSSAEIKDGFQMPDGSTIRLSVQDRFTCLVAYRAICEVQAETTFAQLWEDGSISTICLTPDDCKAAKSNWVSQNFCKPNIMATHSWDNLSIEGLCDYCYVAGQEKHQAGRAEFWEKLPSLFDLPPWAELLKERADM
ncbi:hypothetical protein HWV62_19587 [Athelia sp. TMB]|nr:hypothetical protein HWV62_19587 [Athelia sp. TMB]